MLLNKCIDETRKEILDLLHEISWWTLPNVHILITNRKKSDIEKSLIFLKTLRSVCIQTQQQNDIEIYVKSILTTNFNLKKWSAEVKEEIEEALVKIVNEM
jgi:hypothetical protein